MWGEGGGKHIVVCMCVCVCVCIVVTRTRGTSTTGPLVRVHCINIGDSSLFPYPFSLPSSSSLFSLPLLILLPLLKSHFKRPLWWCGIFTMIFGSLCDFMALSFATQVS